MSSSELASQASVQEPAAETGSPRVGLYIKLIVAYAVMMFAVYTLIPYFVLRYEQAHLAEMVSGAGTPDLAAAVDRITDRSRLAVLIASLINGILLLLGVMLLRLAVRPIRAVSQGMLLLARGERVPPVEVSTADEIGDLTRSFNWLGDELVRYRAELAVREQTLERRVAERTRELDTQKRFIESVVETAELGILTVDRELVVTSWNSYLERTLARTKSDAIGKPFMDVVTLAHRDVLATELSSVLASGEPVVHREFETTVFTGGGAEGRWVCVDLASEPLRDLDGAISGALLTLYDVTERRELHMQLSQSTKLAAVGELAGGVAHEINNPLAIILGNAELLIDDLGEQSPLTKQASTIKRHALRCKEIVANLLKFAGRTQHGSGPIDLERLLSETLALIRKQFELDNVAIEENFAGHLGTIIGSNDELQQVIFALLSNARDAMPKGGTLTVESRRDGDAIEVSIRDTGVGIPKENLERVFSPFFTTKDPGKGTGLGLSVAHTMAMKHGGRISIVSEVGKGTEVVLRLPAAREVVESAPKASGASAVPAPAAAPAGPRMRILLVDDETGIRMVCRETLERIHHSVVECENGQEALAKLEAGTFDLILLDLKMPKLNGAETLQQIREKQIRTPVLIMTGLIDEEMLATIPPGAFSGILKKPFQIAELKSWVAKLAPTVIN